MAERNGGKKQRRADTARVELAGGALKKTDGGSRAAATNSSRVLEVRIRPAYRNESGVGYRGLPDRFDEARISARR